MRLAGWVGREGETGWMGIEKVRLAGWVAGEDDTGWLGRIGETDWMVG